MSTSLDPASSVRAPCSRTVSRGRRATTSPLSSGSPSALIVTSAITTEVVRSNGPFTKESLNVAQRLSSYPPCNVQGFLCEGRSEEHTSELQSLTNIVCRLLLEKKKTNTRNH